MLDDPKSAACWSYYCRTCHLPRCACCNALICRHCARQVPRVALESTTFGDLLFYPAKPGKTVFIISISRIAEATGSLWYTFGSGDDVRACPFKPFFESFMGDLQAQLRSGRAATSRAAKEL